MGVGASAMIPNPSCPLMFERAGGEGGGEGGGGGGGGGGGLSGNGGVKTELVTVGSQRVALPRREKTSETSNRADRWGGAAHVDTRIERVWLQLLKPNHGKVRSRDAFNVNPRVRPLEMAQWGG